MSESRWLVGRHSKVHFWTDNWLGDPLIDLVEDRSSLQPPLDSVVGDIYSDSTGWDIPESFRASHPDVASEIEKVVVSTDPDSLVWTCSLDGVVSCKSAYDSLSEVRSSVFWGKQIWASFIPPSRSVLIWRLFHGKIPTDIALRARGYISPSRCRFCCAAEEDLKHLFLDCPFFRGLWDVVSSTFGRKLKLDGTCLDLWHEAMRLPSKAPRILEVNWRPPPPGCLKVNTDGAAFGSPGLAGCAGVFRTCRGFVKGCFAIPLGVCFAFKVELVAAVHAIDYAWTFGWRRLWLESDLTFVVDTLCSRSRKRFGCYLVVVWVVGWCFLDFDGLGVSPTRLWDCGGSRFGWVAGKIVGFWWFWLLNLKVAMMDDFGISCEYVVRFGGDLDLASDCSLWKQRWKGLQIPDGSGLVEIQIGFRPHIS
ncbi:hypothetical protein Dsin_031496 [Dipteronia sinensis]|uniref:Reverse transcriptase zinc-binding domain-containing protein n=1 Tax=Dipteronia sinensis TaxID=43782 RepID=A0AAD9ZLQ5_9ROSI|nr:hypothetical protein Dsin_031496 [Dipteronia sinensis]